MLLSASAFAIDANEVRKISSVDINKASAEIIASTLDGVGLKKAKAIVEYRRTNGAFKNAEALQAVKGIGEATLHKNKDKIRIK